MRIAPVAEVKAKFSAYLKEGEAGPIVITRNGKAVAVLLAMADEDELERLLLGYSSKFRRILEIAQGQLREGQGIPHEQFRRELQAELDEGAGDAD